MPRIILERKQFDFLQKLLSDHIDKADTWALPDYEMAMELKTILGYTRAYTKFTVVIANDTSPPDDTRPDHAPS
jgi:hypothetical protein